MSWKKNVFSCLMWAVYLLIVGTAMVFTARVVCDSFGMAEYLEAVIPAAYLLFTGIMVFVLHRMAAGPAADFRSEGKLSVWIEGILILLLFTAGLFLRAAKVRPELLAGTEESIYLKLAYVSADGERIPQFSHGAVYLYIWILRLCFMLLGNKAAAAVWMQILLQLAGVLILYFGVRKMAGRIPAVMMAAFFMLSPYMVDKSLLLSPEMLYLLVFSLGVLLISRGVGYVFGWGFWLAAGVAASVLIYLDLAGFLLLPLMAGIIVMQRQDIERRILDGLSGCLAGLLSGAVMCVAVDMVSSGKPVPGILRAWRDLYQWGDLQLSVTISGFNTVWTIILILCLMAWGIFGFWRHRESERFTVWIFCLCFAVLLQGLGMFTDEMSGFCYIFLFSTVLAGLGIREGLSACPAEKSGVGEETAESRNSRADDLIIQDLEEDEPVEEKNKAESRGSAANKPDTAEKAAAEKPEPEQKIEFLENPLPLPKKHVKRVMDYKLDADKRLDGYDIYVAEDDDFDL